MSVEFRQDRWRELAAGVDRSTPLPRLCWAAAHVVMEERYATIGHSIEAPGSAQTIAEHVDWNTTMSIRSRIGATGMGIAEAMDTAQRFSIGWEAARALIERTGALELPAGFCAGAGTDHLEAVETTSRAIDGVCEQVEVIRAAGGVPIILPIPLLSRQGLEADDYVRVYGEIIRNSSEGPLLVHWLGPMFLPELEGYFPGDAFERVMRLDPAKVRGAKLSMLDADLEKRLRADLLERDQLMLTGDDFHFGDLIAGEGDPVRHTTIGGRSVPLGDFSHALLGIFDAIAEPAALALRRLQLGDRAGYERIMRPCEALGQAIFEAPTRFYKTGLAFLAWLDGRQPNRMLANGEDRQRDRAHLARVARLADEAGVFTDASCATERYRAWAAEDD